MCAAACARRTTVPRANLTHIMAEAEYAAPGSVVLCGAVTPRRYCRQSSYMWGWNPPEGWEFCMECEGKVYQDHPHPELLRLKRTAL